MAAHVTRARFYRAVLRCVCRAARERESSPARHVRAGGVQPAPSRPAGFADAFDQCSRTPAAPIAIPARFSGRFREGDGQRNRLLPSFFFRFLNEPCGQRVTCARNCAHSVVPKTTNAVPIQLTRVVAVSDKGDGLSVIRLGSFVTNGFRVSGCVSYTCRCAVRGREAEGGGLLNGNPPLDHLRFSS